MKLQLPKRRNEPVRPVLDIGENRCFIIIGANGAGKTRFTASLAESLGDRAVRLSALDAIYGRSVDKNDRVVTPLEQLLQRLMHDELLNLLNYKLERSENHEATLESTKLDKVISLWSDVFPGNRVLVDTGHILFSRGADESGFAAVRLSDGEKAVLYYAASVLYAPRHSVIFVDSPELFLHPSLTVSLWNRLQTGRPDCTFCFSTHDAEFAATHYGVPVIWVRDCDLADDSWDYELLPVNSGISNELYSTLAGSRKPVLFIEGDGQRSIDSRIYPLIFPDFTVRSLGSCNKVIEATRTFSDLNALHRMDSYGIVDRDRRDETEVEYLRSRRIMVPDVAEIENMLLLEDIVRTMAYNGEHDPDYVFNKVRRTIFSLFKADLNQQALLHTRHRVKRTVEYRVDARFSDITNMERHLDSLLDEINPRQIYEAFCREFHEYLQRGDYEAVLRVYNQKSMLAGSNVAPLCGYKNKDHYIRGIVSLLRGNSERAATIRRAVRRCLKFDE